MDQTLTSTVPRMAKGSTLRPDIRTALSTTWSRNSDASGTAKRKSSSLEWDRAKHASGDAWQRVRDNVERATPGDSDRDGKQV